MTLVPRMPRKAPRSWRGVILARRASPSTVILSPGFCAIQAVTSRIRPCHAGTDSSAGVWTKTHIVPMHAFPDHTGYTLFTSRSVE